jgi:hypothetical protein
MSIPRWRLAIVAAALLLISAIGGGLAQAAPAPATAHGAAAAGSGASSGARLAALRDRLGPRELGRLRKHLVHGTVTVLDRDGKLITLQLDHGTISAIGDGSITIHEAGDTSVTVVTTSETRVRKGLRPSNLDALAVGNEVMVVSVLDGSTATARRIVVLIPRPTPAATTTPAG